MSQGRFSRSPRGGTLNSVEERVIDLEISELNIRESARTG